MQKKALVIIDIQNDITKNYKDIIGNINKAIDWAANNNIHVVYIRHENLSAGTRIFKPNTYGSELASDLKIVSKNVFTKYKGNALTSEKFTDFISKNEICDFTLKSIYPVAVLNFSIPTSQFFMSNSSEYLFFNLYKNDVSAVVPSPLIKML